MKTLLIGFNNARTLAKTLAVFAVLGLTVSAAPASDTHAPGLKEANELLQAVCKGQSGRDQDGAFCRPCPKFVEDGLEGRLTFSSVVYGRFLSARETNAVLDFNGCEAHVNNFGGSVILRWKGDTNWSFVRYEPGNRTNDCLKYRERDGHDFLVCRTFYANMGVSIEGIGVQDLRASAQGGPLVSLTSNDEVCIDPARNHFEIITFERADVNRDGLRDLRLVITEAHTTVPKTWSCGDPVTFPTAVSHRLEFVFDGAQFRATPATARLVKRLEKYGN